MWLDGNAASGLLREALGMELSGVEHGCGSCGAVRPVGAHRLYQGAGWVLRCPECGDVGLRVVSMREGHVVHLRGSWPPDVLTVARRAVSSTTVLINQAGE